MRWGGLRGGRAGWDWAGCRAEQTRWGGVSWEMGAVVWVVLAWVGWVMLDQRRVGRACHALGLE